MKECVNVEWQNELPILLYNYTSNDRKYDFLKVGEYKPT